VATWPRGSQAGSTGPNVAQAGSTWPRVAQAGSTWPRVAHAGSAGPRVAQEASTGPREAQAGSTWPRVAQAMARGEVPGREGCTDRTPGGSQDRGRGGAGKGKDIFVEDDVTRDDDAMGRELEAAIPLVVRGVAKEEAASGAWRQLVSGSSRRVGIAGTTKDAEVGVGRGSAVQGEIGGGVAHRLRGEAVEEVGGRVKGLGPVAGRKRGLEEKAADHVGDGANHAFCPTVLGRCVRARETQLNATSEEERPRGMVVKFAAIVTLQCTDGAVELGGDYRWPISTRPVSPARSPLFGSGPSPARYE
jgi:hypothetical protein